MKQSIISFILILSISLLLGCNGESNTSTASNEATSNSTSVAINYDQLSQSFCDCAQSLIEMNKKMEALHSEGKNEEFMQMAPKVGEKFKETMDCCRKAKESHSTAALDEQQTVVALTKNCSDIPERLATQMAKQL